MDVANSTILITGGGSGIGFGLAKRLARAGSKVIICGRRPDALERAIHEVPSLEFIQCDVAQAAQREGLAEQVAVRYPRLNVLINNAGVQVHPPAWTEPQNWGALDNEIAINFAAPVHLSTLFVPQLLGKPTAAIVNVTSGLSFAPIARMPTYCATKAAMHSFTLSLRKQLEGRIAVVEIVPPAVDTDLGGPGLHTFGVPLDEFSDFAFEKLKAGDPEFGYGTAERARLAGRSELDAIFSAMNSP